MENREPFVNKIKKNKDINIIVATSTNYGIGYDNKMCWHIIISLNDYDNIKKELEDDYINTNTKDKPIIFKNLEEAFKYVNYTDIIESAFIIGGAILYNDCLEKYVDKIKYIYMSIIYDKKYECNKFIAANIIFNNFKFEKKYVTNYSTKYISMKGYNKGISYPKDEPID